MKNNKGITLVELLIVIVILGIIAAVSIPAVGGIVENAQKDAILADALNLRSQANLYCQQNRNADECTHQDDDQIGFTNAENAEEDWDTDWESLDDFIDDLEGTYAVWLDDDGNWQVAIYTGDYSFSGNPRTATRDSVVAGDEIWDGEEDPI